MAFPTATAADEIHVEQDVRYRSVADGGNFVWVKDDRVDERWWVLSDQTLQFGWTGTALERIQLAVNALDAQGGGTLIVDEQVPMTGGDFLDLNNKNNITLRPWLPRGVSLTPDATCTFARLIRMNDNTSDVTVRDFVIDFSTARAAANNVLANGCDLAGTGNSYVNCKFIDADQEAKYALLGSLGVESLVKMGAAGNDAIRCSVLNCEFENMATGVNIAGSATIDVDCVLDGCRFEGFSKRAIFASNESGCSGLVISNCDIHLPAMLPNVEPTVIKQPLAIQNSGRVNLSITGVRYFGNGDGYSTANPVDDPGANASIPDHSVADAISVHGTDGFIISGCYVQGGGEVGIVASSGCHNGAIVGNYVNGTDTAGITVGDGQGVLANSNISVVGNVVRNSCRDVHGDHVTLAPLYLGTSSDVRFIGNDCPSSAVQVAAAFAAGATYAVGDQVSYLGGSYEAIAAGTLSAPTGSSVTETEWVHLDMPETPRHGFVSINSTGTTFRSNVIDYADQPFVTVDGGGTPSTFVEFDLAVDVDSVGDLPPLTADSDNGGHNIKVNGTLYTASAGTWAPLSVAPEYKALARVESTGTLKSGSSNIASVTVANTNEYTINLTNPLDNINDAIIVTPMVTVARDVVAHFVDASTIQVETYTAAGAVTTCGFSLLVP